MPWLQSQIYDGFSEKMSQDEKAHGEDLTINTWPTTTDCIDWSEDAEIVIGAGDDIQLLIPKLKISEISQDASRSSTSTWEMMRLRASFFTPDEMTQEEPVSWSNVSIGEEISSADVVKCRWTPPGISKHGRCALLVQTQNLLLSLWSPEGRPKDISDWQRRAIINRSLETHFERLDTTLTRGVSRDHGEKLKRLSRIRAFGLSQRFQPDLREATSHPLDNFCLLAASNDHDQIVIIKLEAGDEEHPKTKVETLDHCSLSDKETAMPELSWTFEDYMEQCHFAQHISWSPWIIDSKGRIKSLLAYAYRSRLQFRWIILDLSCDSVCISFEDFESLIRLKKPWTTDTIVDWLPDLQNHRYGRLLSCTNDKVLLFTIDLLNLNDEELKHVQYNRSDWHQVAGKLCINTDDGNQILQTVAHITTSEEYLTSLSLRELSLVGGNDELSNAVRSNRAVWDSKFITCGNVLTRSWGLSVSPLQDLIVTCATFHPSNSPEYIIPADMSSRVIFQPTGKQDFVARALRNNTSTEALAFTIRWLFKGLATQPEKNQLVWRCLDSMEQALEGVMDIEIDSKTASFKDILYAGTALTRVRFERTLSLLTGYAESAVEVEKQIIEQIVRRAHTTPESRFKLTWSTKVMLVNFKRILLQLTLSSEDRVKQVLDPEVEENCDICGSVIGFEGYDGAKCAKGHRFGRCALTFQAIQAPRLCKSCGICGKKYLKTKHVEKHGPEEEIDDGDERIPFTILLSRACDSCIYCGGKFID